LNKLDLGAASLEPITFVGEGIKVASVANPFWNLFGFIQDPNFNSKAIK